ncbi:MAG: hypothetical protein R2873_16260 [Caldilineaceae bacterium]
MTHIAGFDEIRPASDADCDDDSACGRHPLSGATTRAKLRQVGACLTESCGVVGGRASAQRGHAGRQCRLSPSAADGTIGLLALDAQWKLKLRPKDALPAPGSRLSIFAGPGKNNLTRGQMLSAFRFRPRFAGGGMKARA